MAQQEQRARQKIGRLPAAVGWHVCDFALRELSRESGYGFAKRWLSIAHEAEANPMRAPALRQAVLAKLFTYQV